MGEVDGDVEGAALAMGWKMWGLAVGHMEVNVTILSNVVYVQDSP